MTPHPCVSWVLWIGRGKQSRCSGRLVSCQVVGSLCAIYVLLVLVLAVVWTSITIQMPRWPLPKAWEWTHTMSRNEVTYELTISVRWTRLESQRHFCAHQTVSSYPPLWAVSLSSSGCKDINCMFWVLPGFVWWCPLLRTRTMLSGNRHCSFYWILSSQFMSISTTVADVAFFLFSGAGDDDKYVPTKQHSILSKGKQLIRRISGTRRSTSKSNSTTPS